MILIDSNIPMYLIGADERLALAVRSSLFKCALDRVPLVTDAEVFQEILHRYLAIKRNEHITRAFDVLNEIVERVFPIESRDVESARDIVLQYQVLSARDAIHVAIMRRYGISTILSLDKGFDAIPKVSRLSPEVL